MCDAVNPTTRACFYSAIRLFSTTAGAHRGTTVLLFSPTCFLGVCLFADLHQSLLRSPRWRLCVGFLNTNLGAFQPHCSTVCIPAVLFHICSLPSHFCVQAEFQIHQRFAHTYSKCFFPGFLYHLCWNDTLISRPQYPAGYLFSSKAELWKLHRAYQPVASHTHSHTHTRPVSNQLSLFQNDLD